MKSFREFKEKKRKPRGCQTPERIVLKTLRLISVKMKKSRRSRKNCLKKLDSKKMTNHILLKMWKGKRSRRIKKAKRLKRIKKENKLNGFKTNLLSGVVSESKLQNEVMNYKDFKLKQQK